MIGSLIYYGLYPLTKLIVKVSESWYTSYPTFINGKEVWNGGGAPFRRLNEQQIALLDPWPSTGSEPSERPKPTTQDKRTAMDPLKSISLMNCRDVVGEKNVEQGVLHKDPEKTFSVHLNEPDPESSEEKKEHGDLTEASEARGVPSGKGDHGFKISLVKKKEVVSMIETEMLSTLEWAQMQAGSEGEFCSQEERKLDEGMITMAVSQPTPPSEAMMANNDHSEKLCGFEMNTNSRSEAQVSAHSPVFDLGALLVDSNAQSLNCLPQLPSGPTGWHFPVGLGLSETVHCPSVQFPGMSYYPAFQDANNFQVMWRLWEDLSNDYNHSVAACTDPWSKFEFTVMSYNILAQDLLEANSELYVHCSEDVLAWDSRFPSILKELQTWQPDILCLQEVQENHFLEQLHPALIEMGYNCVYKRRTGTKTDGCALCYHGKRFVQLSVSLLEFRHHDCELLDRDNVGIVLLLQPVAACGQGLEFRPICVANTHLLFNPRRGDVKLAQLAIVLAEMDSVVKKCKVKGRDCEVILCGDLNSIPNMPLYQLIVTGQLYYHGLPAWMVSGQEDLSYKIHHRRLYAPLWPSSLGISDNCQYYDCDSHPKASEDIQYSHDFLRQLRYCQAACVRPPDLEFIPGVTDNAPNPEEKQQFVPRFRNTISHDLNLSSVYSPNLAGTGRCAVTTLHSERGAMVDYIFYSPRWESARDHEGREKGLTLLGRLALLSEADLWSLRGLPNETFPSDHLSLLAKFQLCLPLKVPVSVAHQEVHKWSQFTKPVQRKK
ncbi:protein angel homolog 1 isoform X2 [Electrophorus electricus]|uniref:protein angel homolog 1 isoform X2 n=1 Tax=Electrophorus electricus TaxID=8005 RepID=UPI0015D00A97|nr:protein angel homolog 1 isoform X2 [Electrophorus electricus]